MKKQKQHIYKKGEHHDETRTDPTYRRNDGDDGCEIAAYSVLCHLGTPQKNDASEAESNIFKNKQQPKR